MGCGVKLPVTAVGDHEGHSLYPETLAGIGYSRKLHIRRSEDSHRALCGVVTDGVVDYLGGRPRPVCVECRRRAEGTT